MPVDELSTDELLQIVNRTHPRSPVLWHGVAIVAMRELEARKVSW